MDLFTKRDAAAPPGFFEVEAAGLAWLGEATADGGAPVAAPVEVSAQHISLPRLPPGSPSRGAAEDLGRGLARTHAAGAPAFGSPPGDWTGDGYIGPITLPHHVEATWGSFYAASRLQPFARSARDDGSLSAADAATIDRVCARLVDGEWDDGRPAVRLHGDLWSGNVVWSSGGAVLVDPAAHGGHGETDLAMLALFGLPHLARLLAGYDEVTPPLDGRDERVGLHQLHPLLVHAAIFGGHYGGQAGAVARRYA